MEISLSPTMTAFLNIIVIMCLPVVFWVSRKAFQKTVNNVVMNVVNPQLKENKEANDKIITVLKEQLTEEIASNKKMINLMQEYQKDLNRITDKVERLEVNVRENNNTIEKIRKII